MVEIVDGDRGMRAACSVVERLLACPVLAVVSCDFFFSSFSSSLLFVLFFSHVQRRSEVCKSPAKPCFCWMFRWYSHALAGVGTVAGAAGGAAAAVGAEAAAHANPQAMVNGLIA